MLAGIRPNRNTARPLLLTTMNIETLLARSAGLLHAISDSPRLDAELLLSQVTGQSRTQLLTWPEREVAGSDLERFQTLLQRRQGGEPLAYVLGERDFWTLRLTVTPAVLVPRPETELLVERALAHLPVDASVLVVDLGTGSGAIALALARERSLAEIMGIDQSEAALAVAALNASQLELPQVQWRHGNWLTNLPPLGARLIVSNPPYIAANDPDLEAMVLAHEPREALIAGTTGMEAINAIIAQAPTHLLPGGWLLFEHGWQQGATVRAALESAGFSGVASHADLAGHERVTEGRWLG